MQKKQVVFIEGFPTAMIYKIARLFKEKGYETVLIRILEANKTNQKFYEQAYDKIIDINFPYVRVNKGNLLKIGLLFLRKFVNIFSSFIKIFQLNPYIIFGRAPMSSPIAFFRFIFRKYPFVYFPYDIRRQAFADYNEARKNISFFEMKADTYCFEHSDGILHKGDSEELDYFRGENSKDKLNLPKNEITIHPYCSKDFIVPINRNKISKKDNKIHMAYVGGTGEKNKQFYFEQFKSAEKIIKEGIHAHFYFGSEISNPEEIKKDNQIKKEFFKEYKYLPNIKYFHLENSFNSKEIAKEVSKYDFGFWPKSDFNVKFATGNKFSTFIEAGIPFFYFKNLEVIDKIAKKYGLNILCADDIKNFKDFIGMLYYGELVESVKRARKDYLMEKHFPRLLKFVEAVVKEKRLNRIRIKSFYYF